jgi:hypothetical protein
MLSDEEAIAAAIDSGEEVLFGVVTSYSRAEGHLAIANLAAAMRGVPPKACYAHLYTLGAFTHTSGIANGNGITMRQGADDDEVVVLGVQHDVHLVDAALRTAPLPHRRHAPGANAQRTEAGKYALKVRDVEVRTRLLDAVDGWGALREHAIDETDEGTLCSIPGVDTVRVLIVRCPSTGRIYGLTVDAQCATVKEARRFLNQGDVDVET